MRVVYVSSLDRGGTVTYLKNLAPHVAATGVSVRVLCQTDAVAESFGRMGISCRVLPLRSKWDLRGSAKLWRELEGADIVHTQDRRTGLLARPLARTRGARVVHTMHGLPEEIADLIREGPPPTFEASRFRRAWIAGGTLRMEAALARLGMVTVPSRAVAQWIVAHGFPASRVRVVYPGIDVRRSMPGPQNATFTLGTAALLERRKGIDVLLEACSRVGRPLHLEIFGDGPERAKLEALARALRVRATFHGFTPNVRQRLEALDAFVLPSRGENLPTALLEAMAAALPVVATSVGGVTELVVDGETGFVVPPEDPDAMAAAIARLHDEPDLRAAMARKGAQRVANEFTVEGAARRMIALYEELCASST